MSDWRERRALHEENRLSWNEATKAHNSHKGDQAAFFRAGGRTLYPEDFELLGDLEGKRLVHLQCNSGQDSLTLAACGADVTGVDISDEAVSFATKLSKDSGITAKFVRADVYDWLVQAQQQGKRFDIVYCSYGAICWLSDISTWAKGVAGVLVPGGKFVTVEFHPALMMFDAGGEAGQDSCDGLRLVRSYFSEGDVWTWDEGIGDYVARSGDGLSLWEYQEGVEDFENPYPVHEFQWTCGEVITALLDAGLRLEHFREYPYSNGYKPFLGMRELPGRRMAMPEGQPTMPMMFSVVASKT